LKHPRDFLTDMDSQRNSADEREIKARKNIAGRFGFVLGCIAAVAAIGINMWRAPRPWTLSSVTLAVLMAALNIPLGIGLGLLGERLTRVPREPRRK
jgi:hypothetical protein